MNKYSNILEKASIWCVIALAFSIPLSSSLTNITSIAAIILSLAAGNWKEKIAIISHNKIAIMMIIIFTLLVFAVFYSVAPLPWSLKILFKYDKLLIGVLLIPIFASPIARKYGTYAFITAMLLVLLCSYLSFFKIANIGSFAGSATVFRSHISANILMAFTAYLFMHKSCQRNKFTAISIIILLLTIYNVLFMSYGRSGYIVFFALLLLFLWQRFSFKGLAAGIILAVIISGVALNFSHVFKLRMHQAKIDVSSYNIGKVRTSVGLRMFYAKHSLELIKKHPIFGTGTGSVKYAHKEKIIHFDNPHNEYLNITIQLGIIGLIALLLLFYYQLQNSLKLPRNLQIIAQGAMLALIVGSFGNSLLMTQTIGYFYVYFTALTAHNRKTLAK